MPAAEHCVLLLAGSAGFCTGDSDEGKVVSMLLSMLVWEDMQAQPPVSLLKLNTLLRLVMMGQANLRPNLLGAAGVSKQVEAHSKDTTNCRSAAREQHTAGPASHLHNLRYIT